MRPWLLRKSLAKYCEQFVALPNSIASGREPLSRRQIRTINDLRHQALEDLVVAAVDVKRPVPRLEYAGRASVGTGVTMTLRVCAAEEVLQRGVTGHQHCVVEQRNFNRLTTAGTFTRHQRAEYGVAGHHRCADIHYRRKRSHALAVSIAIHRDKTALRLRDWIKAEPIRKRAIAPVSRHRAVDDLRPDLAATVIVETQPLHDSG